MLSACACSYSVVDMPFVRFLWQLLFISWLDRFGFNDNFHNEDLLQFGVFHCVLFPHHWAGRREPFVARLVKRWTLCWVRWSCMLCLARIKGARACRFHGGASSRSSAVVAYQLGLMVTLPAIPISS